MNVVSVETISVILMGRQCDLFTNITVITENNLIPASTKCSALFQIFFSATTTAADVTTGSIETITSTETTGTAAQTTIEGTTSFVETTSEGKSLIEINRFIYSTVINILLPN